MVSFQPELWVGSPASAVAFYQAAFGATILMQVGDGEDIVAQLAIGDAVFWVGAASDDMNRLDPLAAKGRTGRTLLIVDDPDTVQARAVTAGATETAPVTEEHGWRVGRIMDPHGHEWEIGRHA
jgi:PhnB protein